MGHDTIKWDSLINGLRDRTVIPIFGPDAVLATRQGRTAPVHHFIADQVRMSWREIRGALPADDRPGLAPLIRGILAHPDNLERDRKVLTDRLRAHLIEAHLLVMGNIAPAPEMQALAALRHLPLFITTSIDGGLDLALGQLGGTAPSVLNVKRITTRTAQDLPDRWEEGPGPIVYHLFGRIHGETTFALSDDEIIESFYKLQGPAAPTRLVEALADHDKLLVGTGLPDWLFRFLFRLTKGRAYTDPPKHQRDVVAEEHLRADSARLEPELLGFLRQFPGGTWIAGDDDPVTFLAKLQQHMTLELAAEPAARDDSKARVDRDQVLIRDHVFISYSYEDRVFASDLASRLKKQCPVWFDADRLRGGEELATTFQNQIANARLFVPLISRHTNASFTPKVFIEEWKCALKTAERLQLSERTYIVPVIVDDLPVAELVGEARKFSHLLNLQVKQAPTDGTSLDRLVTDLVSIYTEVGEKLRGQPGAS